MNVENNHSLSVDCVIFGYDAEELKVLLVKQKRDNPKLKLVGSMIMENETLPDAAQRVLLESTGLRDVYLRQVDIFSNPNRVAPEDIAWISKRYKISTKRVVTVGYYALAQISPSVKQHTKRYGARWFACDKVADLAMDHSDIFRKALEMLHEDFLHLPVAFELLQEKFTIRELQDLCSAVMGVEFDNRNFRKKVLGTGLLQPTGEREHGVAHKPAEYYTFDEMNFGLNERKQAKMTFL